MAGTDAAHLDEAARRALDFDDRHRMALIDRDIWIGYGRAHDAHARLERILRSERRMRPDNLLVVGASNNGKSAIARRFMARHVTVAKVRAEGDDFASCDAARSESMIGCLFRPISSICHPPS